MSTTLSPIRRAALLPALACGLTLAAAPLAASTIQIESVFWANDFTQTAGPAGPAPVSSVYGEFGVTLSLNDISQVGSVDYLRIFQPGDWGESYDASFVYTLMGPDLLRIFAAGGPGSGLGVVLPEFELAVRAAGTALLALRFADFQGSGQTAQFLSPVLRAAPPIQGDEPTTGSAPIGGDDPRLATPGEVFDGPLFEPPVVIPLPAAGWLLLSGLALLGWMGRARA